MIDLAAIFAIVVVVGSPLWAAEDVRPSKKPALQSLIEQTLAEGQARRIMPGNAPLLGFSSSTIPTLAVWRDGKQSSDGRARVSHLVYDVVDRSTRTLALVWQVQSSTVTAEGKFIEGMAFRVSPSGHLQHAMRIWGRVGDLEQVRLNIRDKHTRTAFRVEERFWLEEFLHLR